MDKQYSRQTVTRFRRNRKCRKSSKQGKSEWRIMEGFIEERAFGLTLLTVDWILASTDGRVNFKSGLVAKNELDPGIEPRSPALQVDYLPAEPQGKPIHTHIYLKIFFSIMVHPRRLDIVPCAIQSNEFFCK